MMRMKITIRLDCTASTSEDEGRNDDRGSELRTGGLKVSMTGIVTWTFVTRILKMCVISL